MLSTLRIKNLAIVEELTIDFKRGLNVLTGETGAGKSIVLKAIALLTGERAGTDVIRRGCDRCEIEGLFLIDPAPKEAILLDHPDLAETLEDGELLVRRVLEMGGRSKFSLNGRITTRGEIEQLSSALIDLTGQHEQHRILDPAVQRELLDQFGVEDTILETVRSAFHEFARARDLLAEVRKNASAREEYLRRITFEHEELSQAALRPNEREELEAELARLGHAEFLAGAVSDALRVLEGEGEGMPVMSGINRVLMLLESGMRFDTGLEEIRSFVDSARIQLGEAQLSGERYLDRLQLDPEKLEQLRERVAELARLERKYQRKIPELVTYAAEIGEELKRFEQGAFDEAKLEADLAGKITKLRSVEKKLTAAREKAGKELSKLVQGELEQLNMKSASFRVHLTASASGPSGADTVEFLLSANPGEELRPLAKVASGGELSRVLLVLKTLLNERTPPLVQIFDEVDTGIGGAVAQVVGERLKRLSETGQVLLVTHAPQIAALAGSHYVISKSIEGERTYVSVSEVERDQRIREIARMLAGKKITENFEDSARELLGVRKRLSGRASSL